MSIRIVAALALLVTAEASAEEAVPQLSLEWVSTGTEEALAGEISDLYLTLYNSGNLAVRQVPLTDGFVETLLREQGVVRGSFFPLELDALLCDLNPQVCSRIREPAAEKVLDDPSAHVGGYLASPGKWRPNEGDLLAIPDYAFEKFTTLARVPAPEDWSADTYAAPNDADCSAWKQPCEQVVRRFNPPQIGVRTKSITIPQVQWQTMVPLKRDDTSKIVGTAQALPPTLDGGDIKSFASPDVSQSELWLEQMAPQSPTDLTIESLKRNLGPIGTVEPYQGPAEPLAAEQELLFLLINYPAHGLPESEAATVGVAVFDSQVTSGHCDLPTMYFTNWTDEGPVLAPLNLPAAGAATVTGVSGCSTRDPLAQTDADHAIAVAGIIAAQKNEKGIVGINPAARLLPVPFGRDDSPATLIKELWHGFPTDVRVANMSYRVATANPAAIKDALAFHSNTILVVAAAGNEGFPLSVGCAVYPACFNDLDNVITVVGLNIDLDNPGFWKAETQSTNTSPAFEIGAPAQGVLTTVTNDRFDVKQGTSFAAPQVAAAASLVFAVGEAVYGGDPEAQLSPKMVKDRLIYTADFFPALVRKLYAGRLNVGRAAAVRDAQFDLFDGRRVVGRVDEAPAYFNCKGPADATEDIPWADVRRLTYIDDWTRHILYRHENEGHGSRDADLVRDLSCSVGTKSPLIRVATIVDGVPQEVEFQFLDIRDYTSPLFFR
jgi:subtilisin family serine protease